MQRRGSRPSLTHRAFTFKDRPYRDGQRGERRASARRSQEHLQRLRRGLERPPGRSRRLSPLAMLAEQAGTRGAAQRKTTMPQPERYGLSLLGRRSWSKGRLLALLDVADEIPVRSERRRHRPARRWLRRRRALGGLLLRHVRSVYRRRRGRQRQPDSRPPPEFAIPSVLPARRPHPPSRSGCPANQGASPPPTP